MGRKRNQQAVVDIADRNKPKVLQIVMRGKRLIVQVDLTTSLDTLVGYNPKLAMLVYEMCAFMRSIDRFKGLQNEAKAIRRQSQCR